ncbi:MAG: cation diffusion facilitator family transporter, partial [Shimia sp.]
MGAGHDHSHDHAGHSHGPTLSADDPPEARRSKERAIAIAALLTGGFMGAEVVGGLVSGSLALLADAAHMLTDFASLVLAWLAFRLARRPADWKRTYGFDRFSVLAAFVNGLTLFAIAVWITWEAIGRLRDPHEVLGGLMLWVAVGGLAVNILAFWVLSRVEGDNLNVRAAALHVMGDLLGSVAAIAASLVIIWTGWTPIDPILSVLVVLLILRSAWAVVRESGHILLEGA